MRRPTTRDETRARVNTGVLGVVYLLHFDPPFKHARHYLGWTDSDALGRTQEHIDGHGSPLVKAAVAAGSHVELVRTWENVDRNFERMLKNRGGSYKSRTLCPACKKARESTRATEGSATTATANG